MKFNIQLFADTISTSQDVKFDVAFDDGDTRIITLKNANTEYCTAENAATLSSWIIANQPLVGDVSGTSASTGITTGYIEQKTTTKLDINPI